MLKKRVCPLQTKGRPRLCICFLSWVKRKWNKGKVTTTKRILSMLFIKEKFTSHHTCMSGGERLTFSLSYWHYTGNITFDFTSLMGEVHSPVKTKATHQTARSERLQLHLYWVSQKCCMVQPGSHHGHEHCHTHLQCCLLLFNLLESMFQPIYKVYI